MVKPSTSSTAVAVSCSPSSAVLVVLAAPLLLPLLLPLVAVEASEDHEGLVLVALEDSEGLEPVAPPPQHPPQPPLAV